MYHFEYVFEPEIRIGEGFDHYKTSRYILTSVHERKITIYIYIIFLGYNME